MSAGPNRHTEAYKARKRVRDAKRRVMLRARKAEYDVKLDQFIAQYDSKVCAANRVSA